MNTNNNRFRITALIQMARTTENADKRERYIAQAEEELEAMISGGYQSSSIENFFYENCEVGGDLRTEKTEIYKGYVNFCNRKNFTISSRNALYHFLRENGVGEVRGDGDRYFRLKVIPLNSK